MAYKENGKNHASNGIYVHENFKISDQIISYPKLEAPTSALSKFKSALTLFQENNHVKNLVKMAKFLYILQFKSCLIFPRNIRLNVIEHTSKKQH